jgi:hypothetical protein
MLYPGLWWGFVVVVCVGVCRPPRCCSPCKAERCSRPQPHGPGRRLPTQLPLVPLRCAFYGKSLPFVDRLCRCTLQSLRVPTHTGNCIIVPQGSYNPRSICARVCVWWQVPRGSACLLLVVSLWRAQCVNPFGEGMLQTPGSAGGSPCPWGQVVHCSRFVSPQPCGMCVLSSHCSVWGRVVLSCLWLHILRPFGVRPLEYTLGLCSCPPWQMRQACVRVSVCRVLVCAAAVACNGPTSSTESKGVPGVLW